VRLDKQGNACIDAINFIKNLIEVMDIMKTWQSTHCCFDLETTLIVVPFFIEHKRFDHPPARFGPRVEMATRSGSN
jgi:hypothetical protein